MYSPTTFHLLVEDFHRERMNSRSSFGRRPSRLGTLFDTLAARRRERAFEAAQSPVRVARPVPARD